MDANQYSFATHGAFNPYDQSLDFIAEEFISNDQLTKPTSTFSDQSLNGSARKPPRPQRTKSLNTEHVKYSRVRSGCKTCRSRRVKCDEGKPSCNRCLKGKRECFYAESTTTRPKPKTSAQKSTSPKESPDSTSSDDVNTEAAISALDTSTLDGEDDVSITTAATSTHALPTRNTDADSDALATSLATSSRKYLQKEIGLSQNNSNTQIDTQFITHTGSPFDIESTSCWTRLSEDAKFLLRYHRDHMGHFFYAFKHSCRDFLKTDLLFHASEYEPLLYSIIAFSAYHYTLRTPNGRAMRFLSYYDRAVTLFRQSLASGYRHPLATLLTMLQLCTIEEFLGDWSSLLAHQKAARQMINSLHTPQQMASASYQHRVLLVWYWRFDLYASVMAGGSPTLDQAFFKACADYCEVQAELNPDDLPTTFDHFFTCSRMLATDATILFEARQKGTIDPSDFNYQFRVLGERVDIFNRRIQSAYRDVPHFNKRWTREPGPDTLTDFNDPHFMFTGPFFTMNYILIDTWGANLVYLHYIAKMEAETNGHGQFIKTDEMIDLALKKCKMLEAIQYCEEAPPGAVLCCQASLSIAALFVPDEKKYHDWMRHKFCLLESLGYLYPASMRRRMAALWNVDVSDWWWPDGQGRPPMVKTLRDFVTFRASAAAMDDRAVDVRDLNGIFHSMQLAGRRDLLQDLGAEEQMMDEPKFIPP